MAKSTVKIEVNYATVGELLRGPEILADLAARAARVAAVAGDGMEAEAHVGANRARATVRTATTAARRAEATTRALSRAIDAAR